MSSYDFSRFPCIVAEDSSFMRLLLSSCLGALGIELTQQLNQAIAKYDVSAKAPNAPAA